MGDISFSSLISILFAVITLAMLILTTLEKISKNRNERYDIEKSMALMSKEREYFEQKLYELQNELLRNTQRWEEANNLIISAQNKNEIIIDDKNTSSESFLDTFGIDLSSVPVDNRSVFVLTPFLDRENETFNIIKNVCADVNLNCTRGDEVFRDKDLLLHIVKSIAQSGIVVANINGRNPNVFYELGICHCIGKPVILISKTKDDMPFDIQSKNIVFYRNNAELQDKLKSEFLKIFINKT